MAQRTTGLYGLTQIPRLYELFQRGLGAEASRETLVRDYIRPLPGNRVLDLGCGPGVLLPCLGPVTYVGIDLNAEHIAQAKDAYGDRGRFIAGDFSSVREEEGTFDLVLCIGLLHHLDDDQVRQLAGLALRYLREGGRFIAVDPVFAEGQPWIARKFAAADSGQNVREAKAYRALIASAFGQAEVEVRHNLLRIPYSHCITQAARGRPN